MCFACYSLGYWGFCFDSMGMVIGFYLFGGFAWVVISCCCFEWFLRLICRLYVVGFGFVGWFMFVSVEGFALFVVGWGILVWSFTRGVDALDLRFRF